VTARVVEVLAHQVGGHRRRELEDLFRRVIHQVVDHLHPTVARLGDDVLHPPVPLQLGRVQLRQLREQHIAPLRGAVQQLLDRDLGGRQLSHVHAGVSSSGGPGGVLGRPGSGATG
jgi:hypothetical protein